MVARSLNDFLDDDKLANYLNTLSENDDYVNSDEESVSQIDDGNVNISGDVEDSDESDIIVRQPPVSRISDSESDDPQTDQINSDNSGGDGEDDNNTNQLPTYHEMQVGQDNQYQPFPGYYEKPGPKHAPSPGAKPVA
jgi:hypothetical protein